MPATFINIKQDPEASRRVKAWTGFESVPTLVIAEEGSTLPHQPPAGLRPGASPGGVDRGTMITEPTRGQLRSWLVKNGFLKDE